MKFKSLSESAFWGEYNKSFAKVDVPTEADKDALRKRISCLQQALVDSLSEAFEEYDDFEIGADFDYCFHVCGGIYSENTICRTLVEKIHSALDTDSEPSIWTFHASVETKKFNSQFYVRNGTLVFPKNGPDFSLLMKR